MNSILSDDIRTKGAGETRDMAVSFVPKLKQLGTTPETYQSLIGTPTVISTPSGLTITNKQISSAMLVINGKHVAASNAVAFTVAGGTAGVEYTITVKASTASETNLQVDCRLIVE